MSKVTITLEDLVESAQAFNRLVNRQLDVDVKSAYALEKCRRAISKEMRVYTTINDGLIKKYGVEESTPQGKTWRLDTSDDNKIKAYFKDSDKLVSKKITLTLHDIPDDVLLQLYDTTSLADRGALWYFFDGVIVESGNLDDDDEEDDDEEDNA